MERCSLSAALLDLSQAAEFFNANVNCQTKFINTCLHSKTLVPIGATFQDWKWVGEPDYELPDLSQPAAKLLNANVNCCTNFINPCLLFKTLVPQATFQDRTGLANLTINCPTFLRVNSSMSMSTPGSRLDQLSEKRVHQGRARIICCIRRGS